MDIIHRFEDFKARGEPISLAVGNFDGLHVGHQALLSHLSGHKVVLTFSNHPADVLTGSPCARLTSLPHRLKLLEEQSIDTVLLLPFTQTFAEQSAETFLSRLRAHLPFSHLIMGHDAAIGHAQEGKRPLIRHLAQKMGFRATHLSPVVQEGRLVSSSAIRPLIHSGALSQAARLLGRPYSIYAPVEPGAQQGQRLGIRTANLSVASLCLPPFGVYAVHVLLHARSNASERHPGVANLGHAPTLHRNRPPALEVHLIGYDGDLYGQEVEVIFRAFLRPERCFASPEALRQQIAHDIQSALAHHEEPPH